MIASPAPPPRAHSRHASRTPATLNSPAPRTHPFCRTRRALPPPFASSCVVEAHEVFGLDRARLRASFERASAGYDSAANLQARVAAELLERVTEFSLQP